MKQMPSSRTGGSDPYFDQQPKKRNYLTITVSGDFSAGFMGKLSAEGGLLFVVDPETAKLYSYKFVGGGLGVDVLPVSGDISVQIGVLKAVKPSSVEGWGADIVAYAAAGSAGASGEVDMTDSSGGAGWSGGFGAGVSGNVHYTFDQGKTDLSQLPHKALEELLKYTQSRNYHTLASKTRQALGNKGYYSCSAGFSN